MRKLVVLALLLVACGGAETPSTTSSAAPPAPAPPAPPSIEQAAQVIANAPEFGEFEFTNAAVSIPLQRSAMNEPARDAASRLQKAGWIAFDGSGALVLSAKAKEDKRFLVRPNGFLDIVPLAKKEFIAVTAVRPSSEGADADFTWKWVPNEIGEALALSRFEGTQNATATLLHDQSAEGPGWTVLRIVR